MILSRARLGWRGLTGFSMNYMGIDGYRLDKAKVRAAFNAAAAIYDREAVLQRTVATRMIERLDLFKIAPASILDVGAGTGAGARMLERRYRPARVIQLDVAINMLRVARSLCTGSPSRQDFLCGDAEGLPIGDERVDLVYSNLAVQWCNDLTQVFREFRRVLGKTGLLAFTTFGPDTLKELRESWARVDDHVHVNAFASTSDIVAALAHAGLSEPVVDAEHFTLSYPDVHGLMHNLKGLGSHNVTMGRPHGLTGKGKVRQLIEAYEAYRRNGALPATYEVLYGCALNPP
jgi:malonyl-CoA O-methyltransferase